MCSHQLGDTLQLIIAILYEQEIAYWKSQGRKESEVKKFVSVPEPLQTYENLPLIFLCSKSSVHDAITKHKQTVRKMKEDVELHRTAKDIALKEFVEQEKRKLQEQKEQNNPEKQTNTENTSGGG
jgi:hypothetical protein